MSVCQYFCYCITYADSQCLVRQCCGSDRPFSMSIMDNNQKEVIHIERPLRCSAWCCFCCLQHIEVQSPPGTVVGYIDQVRLQCYIVVHFFITPMDYKPAGMLSIETIISTQHFNLLFVLIYLSLLLL